MQNRERAIGTFSDRANAIYRELKEEFKAGRLDPLRREWCTDRPYVLDFTRCVFGVDQVLPIVRRRGDTSWLIGKLLAAVDRAGTQARASDDAPAADLRPASEQQIHAAITRVYDNADRTGEKPPNIRELPGLVQQDLRETGHAASGNRIMRLAEAKQHADRRRKPGATLASEKRKADFTK